uniref:Uncharacterized protein n=1 Tax=Oryza nivara TaxID=4536 RepID=A0A0E0ILI0_ORYNI
MSMSGEEARTVSLSFPRLSSAPSLKREKQEARCLRQGCRRGLHQPHPRYLPTPTPPLDPHCCIVLLGEIWKLQWHGYHVRSSLLVDAPCSSVPDVHATGRHELLLPALHRLACIDEEYLRTPGVKKGVAFGSLAARSAVSSGPARPRHPSCRGLGCCDVVLPWSPFGISIYSVHSCRWMHILMETRKEHEKIMPVVVVPLECHPRHVLRQRSSPAANTKGQPRTTTPQLMTGFGGRRCDALWIVLFFWYRVYMCL